VLEAVEIGAGAVGLGFREQPGETALAARGQRDQPVGMAFERGEIDMRGHLDRAIEMRHRNERAQIVIALRVLGVERDPVERGGDAVGHVGTAEAEHHADDGLDAVLLGGVRIGHRGVEAVAVGQRGGGKAERARLLGDRLGIDRAVEHGVAGKDAERDVTGMHG
jgi:hypothetical protein